MLTPIFGVLKSFPRPPSAVSGRSFSQSFPASFYDSYFAKRTKGRIKHLEQDVRDLECDLSRISEIVKSHEVQLKNPQRVTALFQQQAGSSAENRNEFAGSRSTFPFHENTDI